jgi:hypothetical protein
VERSSDHKTTLPEEIEKKITAASGGPRMPPHLSSKEDALLPTSSSCFYLSPTGKSVDPRPIQAPSRIGILTLIKTSYSLLSSGNDELPWAIWLRKLFVVSSDTLPCSKLVPETKNGEIELISPFLNFETV